jgi:rhamnose utilization protein RhaD (predicted bifunctional aldolase and dehydrogenase)
VLAEAVVSIGPSIPLVPFAAPGPAAASALRPYLMEADALLLESHGVLTYGEDLEQAYLRMEHVEQVAKIVLLARQLGGAKEIPASALPALLEARKKAFPRSPAAARPLQLFAGVRPARTYKQLEFQHATLAPCLLRTSVPPGLPSRKDRR